MGIAKEPIRYGCCRVDGTAATPTFTGQNGVFSGVARTAGNPAGFYRLSSNILDWPPARTPVFVQIEGTVELLARVVRIDNQTIEIRISNLGYGATDAIFNVLLMQLA